MAENTLEVLVEIRDALRKLDTLKGEIEESFDERQVRDFNAATEETPQKLDKISGAAKGVAVALGAFLASSAVKSIFEVTAAYEQLAVRLETVEGSASAARNTFAELEALASETPFQVADLTEAYIRLKALGLDPTIESLTAFGNVSAAMGTSVIQFAEAVADATVGEFERLKEFGIKARVEGENLAIAYRGTTKQIANDSATIQKFLEDLGRNEFGGAMARQAETAAGSMSTLKDVIAGLQAEVGEGFLDEFTEGARLAAGEAQKLDKAAEGLGRSMGAALGFLLNVAKAMTELGTLTGELAAELFGLGTDGGSLDNLTAGMRGATEATKEQTEATEEQVDTVAEAKEMLAALEEEERKEAEAAKESAEAKEKQTSATKASTETNEEAVQPAIDLARAYQEQADALLELSQAQLELNRAQGRVSEQRSEVQQLEDEVERLQEKSQLQSLTIEESEKLFQAENELRKEREQLVKVEKEEEKALAGVRDERQKLIDQAKGEQAESIKEQIEQVKDLAEAFKGLRTAVRETNEEIVVLKEEGVTALSELAAKLQEALGLCEALKKCLES